MTIVYYDPEMKMRAARDQYFQVNGFGHDGGYADKWVDFKLGPVPFPFPNTPGRIRAVKVHDLHHILTGYDTNIIGEFEISAWEIGAGCKDFHAAWFLNLAGMVTGAVVAPVRVFRAFRRGRRADSLYGRSLEAMLDRSVADMRDETSVDEAVPSATAGDVAAYAVALAAGAVCAGIFLALSVFVVPLGLALNVAKRAEATPTH